MINPTIEDVAMTTGQDDGDRVAEASTDLSVRWVETKKDRWVFGNKLAVVSQVVMSNHHHAWLKPRRTGHTTVTHQAGRFDQIETTAILDDANADASGDAPKAVACLAPDLDHAFEEFSMAAQRAGEDGRDFR